MNTVNDYRSIDERVKDFWELTKKHYQVPKNANFKLPDRTWPDKDIEKAPIWCSVDLRDWNQSLSKPMSVEEKIEIFNMQVQMWFKEIEVWFPAASEAEYNFVRKLIDENLIPDWVKIQVLIQCKDELIEKTRKSLEWAKNVIIHIYNSTSTQQRETVFNKSKEEIITIAEEWVDLVKKHFKDYKWNFQLEYSPESFTWTEVEYAEEICKRVIDRWDSFWWNDIIINLPATVENSWPDRYADKIEYMSRALKAHMINTKSKVKAIISVHAHNDRWTWIAATELAIKAWADRVEWVIWVPNWERSWNVDIWTLALNMFSHWVPPELDLSNIWEVSEKISEIIKIPIHPRYPYTWELVNTAFSWSHQDAISKWFVEQEKRKELWDEKWDVPYLPINPKHIWLEYTPIQINSQSWKWGATFILNNMWYKIPKEMQKSIWQKVQEVTDKTNWTLTEQKIDDIFIQNFVNIDWPVKLNEFNFNKIRKAWKESKHWPIEELWNKISEKYKIEFNIIDYTQHARNSWSNADAISIFKIEYNWKIYFWYWVVRDFEVSALHWLISTINIALRDQNKTFPWHS